MRHRIFINLFFCFRGVRRSSHQAFAPIFFRSSKWIFTIIPQVSLDSISNFYFLKVGIILKLNVSVNLRARCKRKYFYETEWSKRLKRQPDGASFLRRHTQIHQSNLKLLSKFFQFEVCSVKYGVGAVIDPFPQINIA